jgi:hypothetical protein
MVHKGEFLGNARGNSIPRKIADSIRSRRAG